VEGINNKARVITKRADGVKSAKSLWDRLVLADLTPLEEAWLRERLFGDKLDNPNRI
jgi:hypothetical protein